MRRVSAFEVALLEWTAHYQAECYDGGAARDDRRNDPDNLQPIEDLEDGLKLGRVIETLLASDLTSRLSRYETAMQRQLSLTIKDLNESKRPRREFEEFVQEERAKEKAQSGRGDAEAEASYYAELDRQRMREMGPP